MGRWTCVLGGTRRVDFPTHRLWWLVNGRYTGCSCTKYSPTHHFRASLTRLVSKTMRYRTGRESVAMSGKKKGMVFINGGTGVSTWGEGVG